MLNIKNLYIKRELPVKSYLKIYTQIFKKNQSIKLKDRYSANCIVNELTEHTKQIILHIQ